MTVKFKLAQLRKRRGFTQAQLARALGLTLQATQNLEYSALSIKFDTLDRLCHELACAPGDLLELVPNQSSPGEESSSKLA